LDARERGEAFFDKDYIEDAEIYKELLDSKMHKTYSN